MTISLCWIKHCDVQRIRPVRVLDQMLAQANQPTDHGDSRANLVRLNWMVENLRQDRLRKPIFVDDNWQVIVGDTRMMALDILGRTHAPVLAQLLKPEGVVIQNREDLRHHCGLRAVKIITDPPNTDIFCDTVKWVEIVDPDSSHHMHNEDQRARMIKNYLAGQSPEFQFTRDWCAQPVTWSQWDF
jgi:hypothetical protein